MNWIYWIENINRIRSVWIFKFRWFFIYNGDKAPNSKKFLSERHYSRGTSGFFFFANRNSSLKKEERNCCSEKTIAEVKNKKVGIISLFFFQLVESSLFQTRLDFPLFYWREGVREASRGKSACSSKTFFS